MEADPEGSRPCPQNVLNLCSICPQFIPWRQIWNKFGTNWGHSAGHSAGHNYVTTMSLKWIPTSVTAFIIFGAQGSPKRRPKTDFWTLLGNMWKRKSIAPACTGASFLRFGGQPLAGYYYVMSLDQVSLKWVSSESSEYPFWPSEPQVNLKWVPKFLASEYQVSAQVRAKWGRGDKLKLNWGHGLRPSESASIVGQVRLKLFIYNETMTSTIEHFAWHWPAIDTSDNAGNTRDHKTVFS